MGDFLIKSGDLISVTIPPPAIIAQLQSPVSLVGSGTTIAVSNSPVCLEGDELPPVLRVPLTYTAPPFATPGSGTLSVTLLPSNKTLLTENGKAMLVQGGRFTAVFTVNVPATQLTPSGPVPDPVATKQGSAEFMTSNQTVVAR